MLGYVQEFTANPDGRGEATIAGGEGYEFAILWVTRDRGPCAETYLQGVVEEGSSGIWYSVDQDLDENPMILVYVDEINSGEEQFGWVDCRYVSFDPTSSVFEDNEQEQQRLADLCEQVDIDD